MVGVWYIHEITSVRREADSITGVWGNHAQPTAAGRKWRSCHSNSLGSRRLFVRVVTDFVKQVWRLLLDRATAVRRDVADYAAVVVEQADNFRGMLADILTVNTALVTRARTRRCGAWPRRVTRRTSRSGESPRGWRSCSP